MTDLTERHATFSTRDGCRLFYRSWRPEEPVDRALILLHRGHEHSGRLTGFVEELALPGIAVYAWDARGHGRSPGGRGEAPSFGRLVRDLDDFVHHLASEHGVPVERMTVLGHSVAGVIASAWVHDYAPPIRALVLVAPAFRVKLYVPLALPGLRLLRRLRGGKSGRLQSYVRPGMLTHDAEEARRYADDPLIARAISVDVLLGLHETAHRVVEDAEAITVPTLVLAAGADAVVRPGEQRRFFERVGSTIKRFRIFDGLYHDLLHERDREPVLDEIRVFVEGAYDPAIADASRWPACRHGPLESDTRGYTKEEYDRLSSPLDPSPRRLFLALQRLVLRTIGRLSRGIAIGWRSGFDSGHSLDYVYENRPRGFLGLGRWIDRLYLDAPGWRGIRERRAHLEGALRDAVRQRTLSDRPVRVLDVASGPGRYVLETIRDLDDVEISAHLRDLSASNLEAGRRLASELGIDDVRFEEGDAFDEEVLAGISPRPDVVIVSGLFELIPDNERVLRTLRGLARALEEGGRLVYTGQPWHPQLEMIARCLRNRDGRPWIMRRRTQRELDQLVGAAGFRKLETRVDEQGIFTVSTAALAGAS